MCLRENSGLKNSKTRNYLEMDIADFVEAESFCGISESYGVSIVWQCVEKEKLWYWKNIPKLRQPKRLITILHQS